MAKCTCSKLRQFLENKQQQPFLYNLVELEFVGFGGGRKTGEHREKPFEQNNIDHRPFFSFLGEGWWSGGGVYDCWGGNFMTNV